MLLSRALIVSLLPLIQAQETVLGVYIFHRHGDRSTKSYPPTHLTDLGYAEVFSSAGFYRSRYIDSNATAPIYGISQTLAKDSQLNIQAPVDTVLQNSALAFVQGLYPPVGSALGSETLANGSVIESPLGGYQLIPISVLATASPVSQPGDSVWLQGNSGCENAIISSNNYFLSQDYMDMSSSTASFYQSILPVINNTYNTSTDTYKNAYAIWDLVQVSMIHNSTIQSSDLLTPSNVLQLQTLSDHHEFNLAYNASDPIRAVDGAVLAAQVVQSLNATITGQSTPSINVQFGEYANFLAFFGSAQLPSASINFTGIPFFASSMAFELVTNATVNATSYPSPAEISVRFLFANGTAASNPLTPYPLFGQSDLVIPWSTFVPSMNAFAIGDQSAWCTACGSGSSACSSSTASSSSTAASATATGGSAGGGISRAVDGVIGAMVTLAVILLLIAVLVVVGGFRLVRKGGAKAMPGNGAAGIDSGVGGKA